MKYLLTFLLLISSNVFANEVGKPFTQIRHTDDVTSVVFNPDGQHWRVDGSVLPFSDGEGEFNHGNIVVEYLKNNAIKQRYSLC